ncbi:uncharacterized protein [Typha latifolia]|uniref:uncharacterized protein isoform X1 n=1 Tax=Typha latifolia TaxID=4733 RepID=UPI003C2F0659
MQATAKATVAHAVPTPGHVYEDDPHRSGLHAGEEEHHEKKPVLKKVKEKVKKIKDTISKKRHDHDHHSEEEEEEEEEEGYHEDDEDKLVEPDPEVHGAPMYDTTAISDIVTDQMNKEPERIRLGDFTGPLEEDPSSPMSANPAPRGGEEIGTSAVIQSFEAMTVTDQPEDRKEAGSTSPTTLPHPDETSKGEEHQKSYAEKLKSAALGTTEYGKKIASTVYDKVAGAGTAVMAKVHDPHPSGTTVTEGGEVAHQDKGVSMKEYITEKLKPGEEDKALSDVITDAIHKRNEEIEHKVREEATGNEGRTEGAGVVGKIRGAMTSLIGGNAGSHASPVGKTEVEGHVAEGSPQNPSPVKDIGEKSDM